MATYFYARNNLSSQNDIISFKKQEKSFQKYAEINGVLFDDSLLFKEDCNGNDFNDRKLWQKLEKKLNADDTIVCYSIDRFSTDKDACIKKYKFLKDKHINLVFINNPALNTQNIEKTVAEETGLLSDEITLKDATFLIQKLLFDLEYIKYIQEKEDRSKRIKAGIQGGNKAGRKPGSIDKMTPELEADLIEYINLKPAARYLSPKKLTMTDIIKKHKVCRNTLKKYIKIIIERDTAT